MIIYEKQRKILKLFIKKTDEYIEKDDLQSLLADLSDFIMIWGYDRRKGRDNLLGRKLHRLYIEIYLQNKNS